MNKKKVCIILQINDNTDKTSKLISRIFDQQTRIKSYHLKILLVDTGSEANLKMTIKSLQTEYPNLYLLDIEVKSPKEAYRKGMKYAIDKLEADLTIHMNSFLKNYPELLRVGTRIYEFKEFIKYSFVGTFGALVNMVLLIILTRYFHMTIEYASPIAIETAIISNFVLNNFWTFRSRKEKTAIIIKFIRFHMVALTAGLVNYSVLLVLVYGAGLLDILANIIGILSAMMVNYTLNSRWTWKNH